MFEWCQKEMSGGSEREAACATEHDVALLQVRGLRVKVKALSVGVAEHDAALVEVGALRASVAERDEALLAVGVLRAEVTGLEAESTVARKEAATAKSEIESCRLAGQVHEGVSKSVGKLAEKLSREK